MEALKGRLATKVEASGKQALAARLPGGFSLETVWRW
jgi:hypothetical protein